MANQLVPVEPCEGWVNPCSLCEKRFSAWIPIEEEDAVSTIPTKPGAFMFAFDTKRGKEIVAIGIHKENIQTSIIPQSQDLRRQISQKKLKETKASISLRYMIVEDVASKDACSTYTHWQNYGVLPRLTTRWPGREILKNSQDYEYCEESQKWCYPAKDPVWRKQKVIAGPQAVPKCKGWIQNCGYCDGKFTIWLPVEEALNRKENGGGAPERPGFYMFAANKQGRRQILTISADTSIRQRVSFDSSWVVNRIRYDKALKAVDPDSVIEIRWMPVNNLKDRESCFMYAHFLNRGEDLPLSPRKLPGADILESSEDFVFRQRDKQWCHDEGQASQPKKVNKAKERRDMLRSMLEELHT